MILSFILITVTLLSGCQKNTTHSAIEFGTIDVSEIDKIELSGTTGGKDGNYSYTLSDQEKKEFVHLLNQVELGDEVDKNQALSSGAVTYYKLYFQGKDIVTLCPGHYFGVDAVYLLVVDLVGIGACKGLDVDGGAFGQDGLCSFAKGGEHGFDFVEVALGGFVGGGGDEGLAVLFGELRP